MVKSTLYSKIPLEYYFGPVKAECSRLTSCVLYGFLLCMCKSVIGICALWENNALQLANHRTSYISHKNKPYNINSFLLTKRKGFIGEQRPRSWQYGLSAARSIQKRLRVSMAKSQPRKNQSKSPNFHCHITISHINMGHISSHTSTGLNLTL